jgi:nucleoside phosphorylase
VAVLPKSEYGLVSAATVAKDMVRTFPNIRFGLMVGIGGGAPSEKHDIRLGDVMVSTRADRQGGVVQYDFCREEQDVGFKRTGSLNQLPQALLAALSGLQSRYELEGHQLVVSIETTLDRRPRLRKDYSRLGQDTDRLYRPHVAHTAVLV